MASSLLWLLVSHDISSWQFAENSILRYSSGWGQRVWTRRRKRMLVGERREREKLLERQETERQERERLLERRERERRWAGWTGGASGLLEGSTDMLLRERSWKRVETGGIRVGRYTLHCHQVPFKGGSVWLTCLPFFYEATQYAFFKKGRGGTGRILA